MPTVPGPGSFNAVNDNFKSFTAANDNRPTFNWSVARRQLPLGRMALRFAGWVGLAITAYEIAKFIFRKEEIEEGWDLSGYYLFRDCGTGGSHLSSSSHAPKCGVTYAVQKSSLNNISGTPFNIWTWDILSERNATSWWAREGQWWKLVDSSKPPVFVPGSTRPIAQPVPSPHAPPIQVPTWIVPLPVPSLVPTPVIPVAPPHFILPHLDGDEIGGNRETGPQPQPRPRPLPARPWPRPRKREDKKRAKGVLNTALQFVKEGTYTVTEVFDAVECLWNAIPPWKRPKPWKRLGEVPGAQATNPNARIVPYLQKQQFVMNNIDLIDWASTIKDKETGEDKLVGALPCLMMNHLIDLGIGVTSGMAQSEATKRRVVLGLLG